MAFNKDKTDKQEITPVQKHLPADFNLAAQIRKDLESVANQVQGGSVERIRLSGRGFTTPDGAIGESLTVVIVDFASANNHYPEAFDADNPTPPNCFSVGKNPKLLKPDTASSEPQAETCEVCPKNLFESGVGKSKACKNTRVLAVMQENPVEDSPIWLLSVPPASIKFFDTYIATTLRGRHNITSICALTEITMDKKIQHAAPRFKLIRVLADEEITTYYKRRSEAEAILLQKPVLVAA